MTTSEGRVYVWTWLDGAYEPVVAGRLRDGLPDAWSQRVLEAELGTGVELTVPRMMLTSASDRLGAIDFQGSPDRYVRRGWGNLNLRHHTSRL